MAKKKTSSSAKSASGAGRSRRRRSTKGQSAGATAVAEPAPDGVDPTATPKDAPPAVGTAEPAPAARKKTRKKSSRPRKKAASATAPAAAEPPAEAGDPPPPEDAVVVVVSDEPAEEATASEEAEDTPTTRGRPRRKKTSRRRGRRKQVAAEAPDADDDRATDDGVEPVDAVEPEAAAEIEIVDSAAADARDTPRRKRRRGGRGRGRGKAASAAPAVSDDDVPEFSETVADVDDDEEDEDDDIPEARARRRGRRGGRVGRGQSREVPDDIPIAQARPSGGRDMLINVSRGEECRIAIMQDGKLEELYVERASLASHVGNIYKAVVTNVEPSIQAAFIDFGIGKNGFLHISDLQPQYFPGPSQGVENVGQKISRRNRPPIQKCLKKGDQVIVQVIKEGIGTKGPTLSTYLSIPGRYLVMMPGMSKIGVSRKIEDDAARQGMREVLASLTLPPDMGFILRTAGLGRGKGELQRDLNYLKRLWKAVVKRIKSEQGPALLYKESDLVTRTIRDVVTADFDRIVVDDPHSAESAREFLSIALPRSAGMVELYEGKEPLFHRFEIEEQIESIYSKHVPLKSGGSLVIESTEALVAIDVNSGKYRAQQSAEATALRINLEAAEAIAHQLRLRDLGGLIICDFIDMPSDKNRRMVERTLRDALKGHKERVQILRMSQFGIIEMTRQRQRPSIKRSLFDDCSYCKGSGLVKTIESCSLDVMRLIQVAIHQERVQQLTVSVAPDIGYELLNRKRAFLTQLESELNKQIVIRVDPASGPDDFSLVGLDIQQREIKLDIRTNGAEQLGRRR